MNEDFTFEWGVMESYNVIDNAAGLCAGFAGYKISKRMTQDFYEDEGGLVRTGISLICGFVGLKIGEAVRKKTREIRIQLKKRGEDQNG